MKKQKKLKILLKIIFLIETFFIIGASKPGWAEVDYYKIENISSFADHLYEEEDYLRAASEYQRHLFLSSEKADQIIYKIGLCYKYAGKSRKAIEWFGKITREYPKSNLLFSAYYQNGYSYLLMEQPKSAIIKIKEGLDKAKGLDKKRFQHLIGLSYLKEKRWNEAYSLFDSLSTTENENLRESSLRLKGYTEEGRTFSYKSPVLAGLLSAIVPGTGKMYCGRTKDGLYSLILIGTASWSAYNGFKKDGGDSLKGWIWGIWGGVLYAGNVYGSTIAARVYNQRIEDELFTKIQFEIDLLK